MISKVLEHGVFPLIEVPSEFRRVFGAAVRFGTSGILSDVLAFRAFATLLSLCEFFS